MGDIEFELAGANIVVLAETFNPSIASKEWLAEKGVIKEGVTGFIHMPVTSIIETPTLSLFVDMTKLQISLKSPRESQLAKLVSTSTAYIEALPETPYKAVGLNFAFTLKDRVRLKAEFLPDRAPLQRLVGATVERGVLLVFPVSVFRTMMSLKPTGEKNLDASFNFHRDVEGSKAVLATLRHHADCIKKAEEILGGMIVE